MKKKSVWALALAAMLMWVGKPAVAAVNEAFDPVEYVNPLMGTQSSFDRKYLSGDRSSVGYEFLDSSDRKDGRWMAVCIYG